MNDVSQVQKRARASFLDLPTVATVVGMTFGFIKLVQLNQTGACPLWLTVVLGSVLMNLSFTAWHESSHGNLSPHRFLNHAIGVFASFVSVYPGYFARRREHLIHHKFEGDPLRDPVYQRIQSNLFDFPSQLIRVNFLGPKRLDPTPDILPLTVFQRASDRISNGLALIVVILAFRMGYGEAVLWAWVVPRALVFGLHALYVCFFPHSVVGGGYQLYRICRSGVLWVLFNGQNLHGIHHRWPSIPWHKYREISKLPNKVLEAEGIQVVEWAELRRLFPLFGNDLLR